MTSKPDGMIETAHLTELNEDPQNYDLWITLSICYDFRYDRAYVDDRTGEIFCDWLGSLVDFRSNKK